MNLADAAGPGKFIEMASLAMSLFHTLKAVVAWGGKFDSATVVQVLVGPAYRAGTSDLDKLQTAFKLLDIPEQDMFKPMNVSNLHLLMFVGDTRPTMAAPYPPGGHPIPTYRQVTFRPVDKRQKSSPVDLTIDVAGPMAEHLRHSRPKVVVENFWIWGDGAVKKTEVLVSSPSARLKGDSLIMCCR